MTSGTDIETLFTDTNMETGFDFTGAIKAISGFKSWFQFDGLSTDFDPTTFAITNVLDKQGGGTVNSANSFTQATAAKRPTLVPNKIATFPAGVFNGTSGVMQFAGAALDLAADFTLVALFNQDVGATGSQYVLASFNDVSNRTLMQLTNAGIVTVSHGNGTLSLPAAPAVPHAVIMSKSGGKLRLRVDGVAATPANTNNVPGTVIMALGALYAAGTTGWFAGMISDVMMFNRDIIADNTFAPVESYFKDIYNVGA